MNSPLSLKPVTMHSSYFTPTFFFAALWILTFFLSIKPVQAARECYLMDAPYTATIHYSGPVVSLLPKVSMSQILTSREASTSKGMRTECRAGNDGTSVYGLRGSVYQVGYYQASDGTAGLYATNVPGIRYAVQIRGTGGATGVNAYMPYFGGSSEVTSQSSSSNKNKMDYGQWYDYYFVLVQTPEFAGIPSGVTSIQPELSGNIGSFRVGGEDSNNKAIQVNVSTFSVPVLTPTCTSLVSSTGAGTIKLGDYNAAKVNSGATSKTNFTLNASGCTNVTMFKTRLTTNNIAPGNNMLLGNSVTSDAATGVGVKITTGAGVQMKPNDTNSIYSVGDLNLPSSKQLQFSAQLVADKKTISAGRFSATGTFVVNYE